MDFYDEIKEDSDREIGQFKLTVTSTLSFLTPEEKKRIRTWYKDGNKKLSILASMLNAAYTQKRTTFLFSRDICSELLRNDKRSKKRSISGTEYREFKFWLLKNSIVEEICESTNFKRKKGQRQASVFTIKNKKILEKIEQKINTKYFEEQKLLTIEFYKRTYKSKQKINSKFSPEFSPVTDTVTVYDTVTDTDNVIENVSVSVTEFEKKSKPHTQNFKKSQEEEVNWKEICKNVDPYLFYYNNPFNSVTSFYNRDSFPAEHHDSVVRAAKQEFIAKITEFYNTIMSGYKGQTPADIVKKVYTNAHIFGKLDLAPALIQKVYNRFKDKNPPPKIAYVRDAYLAAIATYQEQSHIKFDREVLKTWEDKIDSLRGVKSFDENDPNDTAALDAIIFDQPNKKAFPYDGEYKKTNNFKVIDQSGEELSIDKVSNC